jgi:hypothetical protein
MTELDNHGVIVDKKYDFWLGFMILCATVGFPEIRGITYQEISEKYGQG